MTADEKASSGSLTLPEAVPPEPPSDLVASDNSQNEKSGHKDVVQEPTEGQVTGPAHKSYQFWGIMVALCITGMLGALENTVVTTSLPTIVEELSIGPDYIWVTNIFFLTR